MSSSQAVLRVNSPRKIRAHDPVPAHCRMPSKTTEQIRNPEPRTNPAPEPLPRNDPTGRSGARADCSHTRDRLIAACTKKAFALCNTHQSQALEEPGDVQREITPQDIRDCVLRRAFLRLPAGFISMGADGRYSHAPAGLTRLGRASLWGDRTKA